MPELDRLENPPVVQMTLTVQFGPALDSLSMLDVSQIYGLYQGNYPQFRQVSIAGPMDVEAVPTERRSEVGSWALPRVMMSSQDLEYSVLLQTDRLTFTWMRQSPLSVASSYPGFRDMVRRFLAELSLFREWLSENNFPDVGAQVAELTYLNGFLLGPDEKRRPVGDIVTFFCNPRRAPMTNFDLNWTEYLRPVEASDKLSGTFNVQTMPGVSPDGEAILLLNMVGRSVVGEGRWDALTILFDELHDKAAEIFVGSVRPEARGANK